MYLIILTCLITAWFEDVGAECPDIIKKKEWDGEKPKHLAYLTTPVDLVVIQHTVTQTCSNDQSCGNIVRDIQKIHMNEAFLWDIGPSFLIANTGKIYEGRGWYRVAVHTYGYNNQSIGIAFIGNFNNQEPSAQALSAARALIQCGVDENLLTENHQVVAHSQLLPTESPGKKLANKIKTWPDWTQDVTEIKTRADTQDVNNVLDSQGSDDEGVESRDAGDIAVVGKSRSKREILTTPKQIDLLTNTRDIIAELVDNIRKLAQQTLRTIEALSRGLISQVSLTIEQLTSALSLHRNRINSVVSGVTLVPGLSGCTTPIKNRVNAFYDEVEGKVNSCTMKRINEVDSLIKNLGKLSSEVINFSNSAVEETRNCTELNFGIESTTKSCLNSVTRHTQNAAQTYESQKTLTLNTIRSAMDALPAALDLCSKKPLLDASTETTRVVAQITNCRPFFLPGF